MSDTRKVALVTGGNRGIGLAVARALGTLGLRVVIGSRVREAGEQAASELVRERLDVVAHPLDVTDDASVRAMVAYVRETFGRLDVLVNNAGVFLDTPDPRQTTLTLELDTLRRSMDVNLHGALRMCQSCLPLMREQRYGRIVNVSSILGQLTSMNAGWPAYRTSKAALNALTRVVASEQHGTNILVNAVCPGRVRTRMGGPEAPLSVEEGADSIVWLATLDDDGPSGLFFRERRAIEW